MKILHTIRGDVSREGATVLGGLRTGDGPRSGRARPASIKRDCARRANEYREKCLVDIHTKSRLTLESLRTLGSEEDNGRGIVRPQQGDSRAGLRRDS